MTGRRAAGAERLLAGNGAASAPGGTHERDKLVRVGVGSNGTSCDTSRGIPRHALAAFLIILSMLPIVFVTAMIERYAVDVPYMDQWDMVPTIQLAFEYEGGPRLADLRSQHVEHRPLFPRIVMVALGRLTRWDLIWEMRLNVALVGVLLLVLAGHVRRPPGHGRFASPALIPFYSLLLFSLGQYQNWLMGPTFFMNALSAVAALVLLAMWRLPVLAFCGAMMAAVVGSYSMGNGLLLWPIGAAVIAFVPGATKRRRVVAATLWLGVAALTAISYFDNFQLDGYHSSGMRLPLRHVLEDPLSYAAFVLGFLGAPLTSGRASTVGLLGLGVSVCGLAVLCSSKDGRRGLGWLLPLLAAGFYSIGSGCLASYARIGGGHLAPLESRYSTIATLFWIMNLSILWVVAQTGQAPQAILGVLRKLTPGLAIVAIAGAAVCASLESVEHFSKRHDVLVTVRQGLLEGTASDPVLMRVFPSPALVREYSAVLRRNGLSLFRGSLGDDWEPPPRRRREPKVRG